MIIPKLLPGDIIELHYLEECRFMCNDNVEQFDNIVHPDEDEEFYAEQISRIWRLEEDTCKNCLYQSYYCRQLLEISRVETQMLDCMEETK